MVELPDLDVCFRRTADEVATYFDYALKLGESGELQPRLQLQTRPAPSPLQRLLFCDQQKLSTIHPILRNLVCSFGQVFQKHSPPLTANCLSHPLHDRFTAPETAHAPPAPAHVNLISMFIGYDWVEEKRRAILPLVFLAVAIVPGIFLARSG